MLKLSKEEVRQILSNKGDGKYVTVDLEAPSFTVSDMEFTYSLVFREVQSDKLFYLSYECMGSDYWDPIEPKEGLIARECTRHQYTLTYSEYRSLDGTTLMDIEDGGGVKQWLQ